MIAFKRRPPLSEFDQRVLAAYTAQACVGYRASTTPEPNVEPRTGRAARVLYPLIGTIAVGLTATACAGLTGFGDWYPKGLGLPWGPLVDLGIFGVSMPILGAGAVVAAMVLAKLATSLIAWPVSSPFSRIDQVRPEGGAPVDDEDQGSGQ